MPFTKDQLLLSADKVNQLTKAMAQLDVDDPLQFLCDEAAAVVARMTYGYVIEDDWQQTWIRSVALYNAYTTANVPPPDSIKTGYNDAMKELEAIAKGERPNLPKMAQPSVAPIAGTSGSATKITGRIDGQS